MNPPRKSFLSLMLAGALFGTPALESVQASGAPAGAGHPLLMQLATLPRRMGLRRRVRGRKIRRILWQLRRADRGAAAMGRALRRRVKQRLEAHGWHARGPPQSRSVKR